MGEIALSLAALAAALAAQTASTGDAPAVKRPIPTGYPQNWMTADDTRKAAMVSAYGGLVLFTLDVDAEGKPTKCTVTTSSGRPKLDAFTCKLMMERARFEPARDATGAPVAGTFMSRARWNFLRR